MMSSRDILMTGIKRIDRCAFTLNTWKFLISGIEGVNWCVFTISRMLAIRIDECTKVILNLDLDLEAAFTLFRHISNSRLKI